MRYPCNLPKFRRPSLLSLGTSCAVFSRHPNHGLSGHSLCHLGRLSSPRAQFLDMEHHAKQEQTGKGRAWTMLCHSPSRPPQWRQGVNMPLCVATPCRVQRPPGCVHLVASDKSLAVSSPCAAPFLVCSSEGFVVKPLLRTLARVGLPTCPIGVHSPMATKSLMTHRSIRGLSEQVAVLAEVTPFSSLHLWATANFMVLISRTQVAIGWRPTPCNMLSYARSKSTCHNGKLHAVPSCARPLDTCTRSTR